MSNRPVHPAALLAVGFLLGWAIAFQPAHTINNTPQTQCEKRNSAVQPWGGAPLWNSQQNGGIRS